VARFMMSQPEQGGNENLGLATSAPRYRSDGT
jgi:hypothetical protein